MSSASKVLIASRRRAGPVAGLVLSVLFAAALTPIAIAERWLGVAREVAPGDRSPMTVRVPDLGLYRDPQRLLPPGEGRIVVARGEVVTAEQARLVRLTRERTRTGLPLLCGMALGFALIGVLLTSYLRTSQRGRLLRVQMTTLGLFALLAVAVKAYLLFTPLSAFLFPTAALALLLGTMVDRNAGLGSAVALGLIVSVLSPFDAPVAIVLAAQGVGALLALQRTKHGRSFLVAGLAGACAAAGAYVATYFLYAQHLPFTELRNPGRSALLAATAGGLVAGPLALMLRSFVERLMGEVPKSRLVELADLENPLLKKIAAESPGTWQHSLAMANMAEVAANAIGANGLLVRCGAYYHDLGKSLQPQYYIENLPPGHPSPHDQLPPEVSADAIFSHVTEGVRLGRLKKLPEPIIDFMHMHHGDGLLEYFWSKCLEQGNPKRLDQKAFRYPGLKPQSRETAILAIVDAVEAASRSLKQPDARAIEALVQRIVYGKLHLGQLDECDLSVADLRILARTLFETLSHAHHVRIEYPWQKQEAAEAEARARAASQSQELTAPRPADVVQTAAATPAARDGAAVTERHRRADTSRFVETGLDSADAPRPFWYDPSGSGAGPAVTGDPTPVPTAPASPGSGPLPVASSSGSIPASASGPLPAQAPVPGSGSGPIPISAPVPPAAPAADLIAALTLPPTPVAPPSPQPEPAPVVVIQPAAAPVPAVGSQLPTSTPAPASSLAPELMTTLRGRAPALVLPAAPSPSAAPVPPPPVELTATVRGHATPTPVEPGSEEPTIELMKDALPAAALPKVDDDALAPGTMVLGPPPATYPERDEPAAAESSRPLAVEPGDDSGPVVTPAVPAASMTPPRRRPPPPPQKPSSDGES